MPKEPKNPALKDILNKNLFKRIAEEITNIEPRFNKDGFLKNAFKDFDSLSLMERLRRMTDSFHSALPAKTTYRKAIIILKKLIPKIGKNFATLMPPQYVSLHGLDDFEVSMDALKFFTPYGSSEFAVRPFIKQDLKRALGIMTIWAKDKDEHVRRLASEGCRPRLPWSFQLTELIKNPAPVAPILETLRDDASLYVRKSVANHLNDITKDHPDWVIKRLEKWQHENSLHTQWIIKHALRTLIKKGNRKALSIIGAGEKAKVRLSKLHLAPKTVCLNERLRFSFEISSTAANPQKLVIDYAVHYVKKSGSSSPKVFKLKQLDLAPKETVEITRNLRLENYTTRTHYSGRHLIEIFINGELFGKNSFELKC